MESGVAVVVVYRIEREIGNSHGGLSPRTNGLVLENLIKLKATYLLTYLRTTRNYGKLTLLRFPISRKKRTAMEPFHFYIFTGTVCNSTVYL